MKSISDLSVHLVTVSQLKGRSNVSCCYGGGQVTIKGDQPLCGCGQPVIKLISQTDPGSALCCQSIADVYHLSETERRSTQTKARALKKSVKAG